ncbi:ribonuclease HIII [Bulleidia sp. zg-1006]|uniref:ribonuclease HIII n=1 Tax=Bulleidia sp. zg-1006 TaxID=2806552 RepID=UPI001EEEA52A|nr:ribonuclease HIII [Bulleidia sp. zg-1006]
MKNSITVILNSEQAKHLYQTFHENEVKKPPYSHWQLKLENCVITYYQSGKCLFQGSEAEIYASAFIPIQKEEKKNSFPQAGSDEVGTGDYFGPVVVCACYVEEEQLDLLKSYRITDSKAMSDRDIRKASSALEVHFPHAILSLSPASYNELHRRYNMNATKALLHNQAYLTLAKKVTLPDFCIIDQFTPKKNYYSYLTYEPEVFSHLHFEIRAENHYASVALASVFARNRFLEEWDAMNQKYNFQFQKGAGSLVDACAKDFVQQFGYQALRQVAKLHFKNTDKLKEGE